VVRGIIRGVEGIVAPRDGEAEPAMDHPSREERRFIELIGRDLTPDRRAS